MPDYFANLGVRPFINAIGPYSSLGGAEMWPEVIDAMDYAIKNKARMSDLHDAVGKRIAELTGAEAAMVTAGATCGIILGTVACVTMGDEQKMERLPDTSGMANEVIILKRQRYPYDRSIRAPGAKLVEVASVADIRAAINPATAMLFYLLNRPDDDTIEIPEYVAIAKEHGIPILCDAATTVPPIANLKATVAAGFDLICYSGGKGPAWPIQRRPVTRPAGSDSDRAAQRIAQSSRLWQKHESGAGGISRNDGCGREKYVVRRRSRIPAATRNRQHDGT